MLGGGRSSQAVTYQAATQSSTVSLTFAAVSNILFLLTPFIRRWRRKCKSWKTLVFQEAAFSSAVSMCIRYVGEAPLGSMNIDQSTASSLTMSNACYENELNARNDSAK